MGGGMEGGGEGELADAEGEELLALLEELGVTPEELEAAIAAEGGGEMGGGEMGGGGMPPEMGGGEGMEVEANDRRRGHQKAAAVKKGQSKDSVREYITELIGRSRQAH